MKLLSFQSFSLYKSHGGSRILRRLYDGMEDHVFSLAMETQMCKPTTGKIEEKIIYSFPLIRPWMRWKLPNFVTWLREHIFKFWTLRKIRKAAAIIPHDIVHVVNHTSFSHAFCSSGKKPLWVSFHDHFSIGGSSISDTKKLWNRADRRLVISSELGKEYSRLFGIKKFEIITDGQYQEELSNPVKTTNKSFIIYFAGSLHVGYLPLFRLLADALDILYKEGLEFKLVLRGTNRIILMENRLFEIEYRPETLNDLELKQEIDSASILYLPIKFSVRNFYLYSLSTKMVGYLGASGSILYHGPENSAACKLLTNSESAICCVTLNTIDLVNNIKSLLMKGCNISTNAKKLATESFNLTYIQHKFWFS